jgi:hypothetical protein
LIILRHSIFCLRKKQTFDWANVLCPKTLNFILFAKVILEFSFHHLVYNWYQIPKFSFLIDQQHSIKFLYNSEIRFVGFKDVLLSNISFLIKPLECCSINCFRFCMLRYSSFISQS